MNETVLVVDDQDVVRDVIRLALEGVGYTVLDAASPLEAIALARSDSQIDLLVTDVVMPEMDAFELAERITSELPEVRVLFTSGYTDAAAEGPFIQKPFTPRARREGQLCPSQRRTTGPRRPPPGRNARSDARPRPPLEFVPDATSCSRSVTRAQPCVERTERQATGLGPAYRAGASGGATRTGSTKATHAPSHVRVA